MVRHAASYDPQLSPSWALRLSVTTASVLPYALHVASRSQSCAAVGVDGRAVWSTPADEEWLARSLVAVAMGLAVVESPVVGRVPPAAAAVAAVAVAPKCFENSSQSCVKPLPVVHEFLQCQAAGWPAPCAAPCRAVLCHATRINMPGCMCGSARPQVLNVLDSCLEVASWEVLLQAILLRHGTDPRTSTAGAVAPAAAVQQQALLPGAPAAAGARAGGAEHKAEASSGTGEGGSRKQQGQRREIGAAEALPKTGAQQGHGSGVSSSDTAATAQRRHQQASSSATAKGKPPAPGPAGAAAAKRGSGDEPPALGPFQVGAAATGGGQPPCLRTAAAVRSYWWQPWHCLALLPVPPAPCAFTLPGALRCTHCRCR